ncbi:MAG: sulfite exporter TauE/SafE family protein [Gammaproteobacteria bacterium]|nr:MAG: sulfite exporter TauE/SafE family protein [Gammaproteobacteria bacterium]
MLELIIIGAVLATSILSGVLGMAGGMILMAILVSTLSVGAAMMLHGAVQAMANGSRSWFLRQHVQWRILPAYALGAGLTVVTFTALALVPDANLILILVGIMPFLARAVPHLRGLDVTHLPTAALCGLAVTAAQLFAGASGALLDVFYLNARLNRFQIIATKAFTQAIGHLLKLFYYGLIIGVTDSIATWVYAVAILTAVVGTRLGTRLLERLSDESFRRVSGAVILLIGGACVIKGVWGHLTV